MIVSENVASISPLELPAGIMAHPLLVISDIAARLGDVRFTPDRGERYVC